MKPDSVIDRLSLTDTEFAILMIAVVFLFLAVLLILFLFVSRTYKNTLARKQQNFRREFQLSFNQMIVNEVFSKTNPVPAFEFQLAQLRRLSDNSKLGRQTMVDQLISMRKSLSGASGTVLDKAYQELNGRSYSSSKLNNIDWKIRAQGIREMTEMSDDSCLEKIKTFVQSNNLTVREEAIVSIVRLERPVTLAFLDTYGAPLSSWLKINIHHHLARTNVRDLPNFSQWFNHSNPGVVVFAVEMTKFFRQTSSIDKLAALLDHSHKPVVVATFDTLGELEAHTVVSAVIAKIESSWNDNELSQRLVVCLGRLAHDKEHMLAVAKYLVHPNYTTRFEAVKALSMIGRDARKILEEVNSNTDNSLVPMMRHVDEPLLN